MSLFVDTTIWYAAADRSDVSNGRAKAVLSAGEALVTTDHVLVEEREDTREERPRGRGPTVPRQVAVIDHEIAVVVPRRGERNIRNVTRVVVRDAGRVLP